LYHHALKKRREQPLAEGERERERKGVGKGKGAGEAREERY